MIIDDLVTAHCDYGNMDVRLARAFDWLRACDFASIDGTKAIPIDGSRIFALPQAYDTIPSAEGFFEAHRAYIDIQYMIKGSEIMEWCPQSKLTSVKAPYDFEKDLIKYDDPSVFVPVLVGEGQFCVFFPTDGHKPKCMVNKPAPVKKIVIKVAV